MNMKIFCPEEYVIYRPPAARMSHNVHHIQESPNCDSTHFTL
jgi:hypothetical protein